MLHKIAKTLLFSALPLFLLPLNAQAQIAADGTTSTTVTPTDAGVRIDEGDRSGGNLFHSFRDFSVQTGTEAHFNNANDVANIFSRVTGSNISDIDGLIRANGTANLFLINPNGIILGENASLNIGGSFFATTADGILFDDGIAFSASDPTTPLLSSSIPVGANFRGQPGDIINRAGDVNSFTGGLTVSAGNTITLLGGNLEFEEGFINASGANIELGGLIAEGTVDLEENGSLNFPENVTSGDITFDNSVVNVQSNGGGNITLQGKSINLENNSELAVGIAVTSINPEAQAGNLEIDSVSNNPEEGITFDNSIVFNTVEARRSFNDEGEVIEDIGGQGNAGNIRITGNFLSLDNGSQIQSLVRNPLVDENGNFVSNPNAARGNAGNIVIDVSGAVTITGEGTRQNRVFRSLISSEVQTLESNFNAGTIGISADSITQNNGRISATSTNGTSGDVGLLTNSLTLDNGSEISSQTDSGTAGNVIIARDEDLNFIDTLNLNNSSITVDSNAGRPSDLNLTIIAETIQQDNGTISANSTSGTSGNIEIVTNSLTLDNGSEISSQTDSGDAGDVFIRRDENANFIDTLNLNDSSITVEVLEESEGTGGFISIIADSIEQNDGRISATSTNGTSGDVVLLTNSLTLDNGSEISSQTDSGDAGNIVIARGEDRNLDTLSLNSSDITVEVLEESEGTGGFISIIANSVTQNNGRIAATSTNGESGDVVLFTNSLTLNNNSEISSETESGTAGNILIQRDENFTPLNRLELNNSRIIVDSNAGRPSDVNFTIVAKTIQQDNGTISANSTSGTSGNIEIVTNSLTLDNGSEISSQTDSGDAGDVFIRRDENANFIDTLNLNDSSITVEVLEESEGSAGDISIIADSIEQNDGRISATSTNGTSGNVVLSTNSLTLDNESEISSQTDSGDAGFIAIASARDENVNSLDTLNLNNSEITVEVLEESEGDAGTISISADSIEQNDGRISATSTNGTSGNVVLSTNSLTLDNNSEISSETESGTAGNILIQRDENFTPLNRLELNNSRIIVNSNAGEPSDVNLTIVAETIQQDNGTISANSTSGTSGNLEIVTNSLTLDNGSEISSQTDSGDAGDVFIRRENIDFISTLNLNDSSITVEVLEESEGDAGTISISADSIEQNDGRISATSTNGTSGNVVLSTNSLTLDNESEISSQTDSGDAGFIVIARDENNNYLDTLNINSSEITVEVLEESEGDAGTIGIYADSIEQNDGRISATSTNGASGNVVLSTNSLTLDNESEISSQTDSGDAGFIGIARDENANFIDTLSLNNSEITVEVLEESEGSAGDIGIFANSIEQDNGTISAQSTSGISGNVEIFTNSLTLDNNSSINSQTNNGIAGGITIENQNNAPLEILNLNNSNITVKAEEGSGGTAGNIEIATNLLEQDGGEIIANTESTGANINLAIQDFWFLRNESKVEADARGSENQQSTGGNININSNNENSDLIIIAFPAAEEGNDITANGFGANAGQIDINANLLGTQVRNTEPGETGNNFLNDITARSDISNENNVEQSNVEDPSGSLVELPETVGDASDTIAQNPCEQGVGSEFLITGRGGFPANPQNNFSSNEVRVDLVQPVTPENQTATVGENNATSTEEPEVVPAQGWVFNNEGKVVLTAYDPTNEGVQRNQQSFTGCSVPQNQVQQNN